MKKFIAVSAALVLVAGSAFAEFDTGVRVDFGAALAQGDNADGTDVTGQLRNATIALFGNASTDIAIGSMGAEFWIERTGILDGFANLGNPPGGGFWVGGIAWWRPIEMLFIGLGNDHWQLDDIRGGGVNANQNFAGIRAGLNQGFMGSVLGLHHDTTGFYNGMGTGLIFDVNTDMVDIGVGLPYPMANNNGTGAPEVADVFAGTHVRAGINLDGVGRIGFAYRGSDDDGDNGSIFASFSTPASNGLVDGLSAVFGVGFHLVDDGEVLEFGLGVGWNLAQQFGLGFRYGVSIDVDDNASDRLDAVRMGFELVPRFEIMSGVRAYLPIALGMGLPGGDNDADDNVFMTWRVNPYVRVNITGNVGFLAGFDLEGHNGGNGENGGDSFVRWAIPIGMRVQF